MSTIGANRHDAGFYASDDEFAELIVAFVDDAVAAGEPVVLGYGKRKNDIVRSSIASDTGVSFVEDCSLYATPTRAIASYQRLIEQHVADGAPRIRLAGEVPHPGTGRPFTGWDRYESAINVVWDRFPVWLRCLYDATVTAPAVRDAVERSHREILRPGLRPQTSPRFEDPQSFRSLTPAADPLEAGAPDIVLVDSLPAEVRRAVTAAGSGHLDSAVLADLAFATSEAVANAELHGRSPATVRVWTVPGRLVVTIHDSGAGPRDRLVGLVPSPASATGAGLGLWLAHRLDITADLTWAADGFTVRLRAGSDR